MINEAEQFRISMTNIDDDSMRQVVEFLDKTEDTNTYAPYKRKGGYEELRDILIASARHRLHEGWCQINGSLGYIIIPKNASSSLRAIFDDLGWGVYKASTLKYGEHGPNSEQISNINNGSSFHLTNISEPDRAAFNPEATQLFAVLRDPVDRWISGFTQVFHSHHEIVDQIINGKVDKFIEDPWFDTHQAPQSLFLQLWEKVTTFKMENMDKLVQWLKDRGVDMPTPERYNATSEIKVKVPLYRKLEELMTPERREKLNKFYAKDLELYEKAI